MTFKEWIIDLLKDERGGTSIKPVIALIGSLVLFISLLIGAWIPEYNPPKDIINAVMVITGIAIGSDTMDKFSYRPKYNFKEEEEEDTPPPKKP